MGHDPGVCAHAVGSNVSYALGQLAGAEEHARSAVELAKRVEHAPTLAFALWFVGCAHAARSDIGRTKSVADELLRLSEEQRLPQMRTSALILGGWATAADGEPKAALREIDAGLSSWRGIGMRNFLQVFGVLAAEVALVAGDYEESLRRAAEALAIGKETGEGWWTSRGLTVQGSAFLHLGDRDAAEDRFDAALQEARQQGARSWELRAATSLARLWSEQGEPRRAHDLLEPIHGWFTGDFDTADLRDAKALLDALR
jgi:predicted ATPase